MNLIKPHFALVLTAVSLAICAPAANAATIVITSRDAPNVGFNDPTPVAPIGGNPGTTLGAQRMYVYRYVANLWEKALQSSVPITVNAGWEALSCTSGSAVLGSAGAWNIWHDFPGGVAGTWYPQALANKLSGANLSADQADDGSGYGNVDIKTQFNVNLGQPDCLAGIPFYLGVDGNSGVQVNFVETLLHELGHGLGFSVLTVQGATGYRVVPDGSAYAPSGGLPSVWEGFMYDNTAGKTWLNMTNAQRAASAINPAGLAWAGSNAVAGAAITLGAVPKLLITTPVPGVAGAYDYGTAGFGPAVASGQGFGVLANIGAYNASIGAGCAPFSTADAAAVRGKVAIIDRGVCTFTTKVTNAQAAGAFGVIIANNVAGAPPALGGASAQIVIPTASVSQADGVTLKAAVVSAVKYGSRSQAGSVSSVFGVDPTRRAGADAAGRPLLYTPNPLQSGSSISHWDSSASPNLLMEPAINADLTTVLVPPKDLTVPLLKDLGW